MKVASKLILTLVAILIGLRALDGYFTVQREINLFNVDTHRDTVLLGEILSDLISRNWHEGHHEAARHIVDIANKHEHPLDVRWIPADRLDAALPSGTMPSQERQSLMQGEDVFLEYNDAQGTKRYFSYVPVEIDDQYVGYLEMSEVLTDRDAYIKATIWRELLLAVLVLVLGVALTAVLGVTMVGRPLNELAHKIDRVSGGDLGTPLHMDRRDEIGILANGLNNMCARLQESRDELHHETEARLAAMDQLRHVDRLATIGSLASGVAHELGTPLNVISGRAGMIANDSQSPAQVVKFAQIISQQTERMTGIIRNLLSFARPAPPNRRRMEINDLVSETLALVGSLGHHAETVQFEAGPPMYVMADASQIQQVLTNILDNALQVTSSDGRVRVAARLVDIAPPETLGNTGTYAAVEVCDNGPGIPEEHRTKIFDPFFTTKDVGKGTGLGLSIAWGIVKEHGGWIGIRSDPGKGSCFTVYLPLEVDT